MTLLHTQRCLVLTDRGGEIGRLGQFNDVATARRFQLDFLPKDMPKPDGWELAAALQPAREVAGDFYDVFTLTQGRRVGLVIADVDAGHPAHVAEPILGNHAPAALELDRAGLRGRNVPGV